MLNFELQNNDTFGGIYWHVLNAIHPLGLSLLTCFDSITQMLTYFSRLAHIPE